MPIRWRLTLWYSAVLLLGLALFSTATWLMLERRMMAAVNDRLAQKIEGLQTLIRAEAHEPDIAEELREFARSAPEGALMQVRDEAGKDVLPAGRPLDALGPRYRVVQAHVDSFSVTAATSLDDVDAILRELRNLLLWLIPADLAAACLGGYFVSRRALAPVAGMTRTAESIGVQDLSKRLDVPTTGDELQHLAETWNDFLSRLEQSVDRVRQFTADASHELRTPVSLIHATAELALRRDRTPGNYRDALQQILTEAGSMATLTESLLTLARSDLQALEMPLSAVDLGRVAKEAARINAASFDAHGMTLYADVNGGFNGNELVAFANELGIRRLLTILLDNAAKFTPSGGTVFLSVVAHDEEIRLEVQDSGPGIPDDALPHIFERFYRADPAHSGPGAGLGLAIAQAIAHAHGSEIKVENKDGSRFSVALKRVPGPRTSAPASSSHAQES